jgi:RNA polymerase sigma-70 factor (ECF subfamily)
MVGSVADAEDIVQEAYLRWQEVSGELRSPRAFLTTIVTRLAINFLHAARVRREVYVGPWLPEPLATERTADLSEPLELAESLSMAFLILLERLAPVERAVLLLHDVFDFEHAEIARIVDRTEVNCRQLLSRARRHLGSPRRRFEPDPVEATRLTEAFSSAARTGDVDRMLTVLAKDITLYSDSGGKAGAADRPIHGAVAVANHIVAALGRFAATSALRPMRINGEPGLVVYDRAHPVAVLIFDVREHRIHQLYAVVNPEKLRNIPHTDRDRTSPVQ